MRHTFHERRRIVLQERLETSSVHRLDVIVDRYWSAAAELRRLCSWNIEAVRQIQIRRGYSRVRRQAGGPDIPVSADIGKGSARRRRHVHRFRRLVLIEEEIFCDLVLALHLRIA